MKKALPIVTAAVVQVNVSGPVVLVPAGWWVRVDTTLSVGVLSNVALARATQPLS